MSLKIHYLQHVPFEGLGSIEAWARAGGHPLTRTRFFAGEALAEANSFDWLVIMGGPMGVYEERRHPWLKSEKRFIEEAIRAERWVLGICLGAQLLADVLGARVFPNRVKEVGWFPIQLTPGGASHRLFSSWPREGEVLHWHGDTFDLPAGALHVARSAACENQAFVLGDRIVGLQFHLEMTRPSVEALVRNCAGDLTQGPCIQSAEQIVSEDRRFEEMDARLTRLLDGLARLTIPYQRAAAARSTIARRERSASARRGATRPPAGSSRRS